MKSFFYGWVIVFCAFTVLFLTYGAQYSFGVFIPAMLEDLGWTRASLGAAFSLYTVVYTSLSVVSGRLTDSLGPRRVIGFGAVLLGLGLCMTSQVTAQWQIYFCYSIVAAIGMSSAYIPCNMTLVRWFVRKRGLALGIASSGASCGFLFVPLIAGYLIAETSWRTALLVVAIVVLVVISVIARFMVSNPESIGLTLDGEYGLSGEPENAVEPMSIPSAGMRLGVAAKTIGFWILLAAFTVAMLSLTVPFVHIVGHAQDLGISGIKAAMTVSIIGLFSLVGSVVLGLLSDRFGRKLMMLCAFAFQTMAFVLFAIADTMPVLYCGAAAFGLFYGGFASLYPALVGDMFGRAHSGAIGGAIFGAGGFLGGWGPAIAGYLRDVYGNFELAFLCCVVTAVLSLVLLTLMPMPKQRPL